MVSKKLFATKVKIIKMHVTKSLAKYGENKNLHFPKLA